MWLRYTVIFLVLTTKAYGDNLVSYELASDRIINGKVITIESAPYTVQLRNLYNFTICGGTLISLQHVLTAAHCMEGVPLDKVFIVAGASLRTDAGIARNISKVLYHPQHNRTEYIADVAILKLDRTYESGEKIQALEKFCTKLPEKAEFMTVSGWGATSAVENFADIKYWDYWNQLRQVQLPIIENSECVERCKDYGCIFKDASRGEVPKTFFNTNFCVYKKDESACVTDSGGPGTYGGELCGVVAGGFGCAWTGFPSYYTSVPAIIDFIKKSLKE